MTSKRFLSSLSKMIPLIYAPQLPAHAAAVRSCDAATFSTLSLENLDINSLSAVSHVDFTVPSFESSLPPASRTPASSLDICFLTINYTHPGEGDSVTTWVGLPLAPEAWNGRFLMSGGSGWLAGHDNLTVSAVASGYASASTDAGHGGDHHEWPAWGLLGDGSVNWPALRDFGSRALVEAVYLGKLATELYFGEGPKFSYWNGCSTGGRQGHVMAELIPEEFDGIVAGAPAINWAKFIPQEAWGYVTASAYGISPPQCVFDAFTQAAVDACDQLDGVEDRVISLPHLCDFDPLDLVGRTIDCSDLGANVTVTRDMALLAQHIWAGPKTAGGDSLWYGVGKDASLAGKSQALLTSTCDLVDDCTLSLFSISQGWIQTFLQESDESATFNITVDDYYAAFNRSVAEYSSVISADNPDLTALKTSGTKMMVWHGMSDGIITPDGSVDFYERVVEEMGEVDDFYRLYLAPGVGHCGGGPGLDPTSELFFELVDWVENGTVPGTIAATGPAVGPDNTTATRTIGLCPYPEVLTFTGTDPNSQASFECR